MGDELTEVASRFGAASMVRSTTTDVTFRHPFALKDLERAAWKHARETGHVVDLGDITGEARQITRDSPDPR